MPFAVVNSFNGRVGQVTLSNSDLSGLTGFLSLPTIVFSGTTGSLTSAGSFLLPGIGNNQIVFGGTSGIFTGSSAFTFIGGSGGTLAALAYRLGLNTTTPGSSLPSAGVTMNSSSSIFEMRSPDTSASVGILMRRSDGATGLDMWSSSTGGGAYIDNRYAGAITFRNNTSGTPNTLFTLLSTGQIIQAVTANPGLSIEGLTSTLGTSGSTNNAIFSIQNGSNYTTLFAGINSSGVAWIQVGNRNDLSVKQILQLNPNGGTLSVGGVSSFSGNIIAAGTQNAMTGVATNTAAAAGQIGEIISVNVASGSAAPLTTGTAANVGSITLTAGHWGLYGVIAFTAGIGTTTTYLMGGNSTTSATIGPLGTFTADDIAIATTTVDATLPLPFASVDVAAGATKVVYLVAKAGFAISTLLAYGYLEARRMW